MIINTIYSVPSKKHATQYFTVPATTAASQGAITDAFHECFATVGWAKGKASSL